MLVKWDSERYGLGIPDIDEQHRELFILTNALHDTRTGDGSVRDSIKILKQLYAYANYHFLSEERVFRENDYPGTDSHISTHTGFREEIKEYLQRMREKSNTDLAPLQDYLIRWIVEHVNGADREYAEYFSKNGIIPDIHISSKNRAEALIMWEENKLSLEIAEIDRQHKELVFILQTANDLNFANEKRIYAFLPEIIKKIFYYSQYHFSFEEEHMAKNNFTELSAHRDWHRTFVSEAKRFAEKYNQGKSVELVEEIVFFLKDWTINHILTEDKKYKEFLAVKS